MNNLTLSGFFDPLPHGIWVVALWNILPSHRRFRKYPCPSYSRESEGPCSSAGVQGAGPLASAERAASPSAEGWREVRREEGNAERVMRNPHVALAVYGSPTRERILAYISLLPLPESTIFAVLRGERHETKIHTEEVETYERQGGYTLLAESVVVDPDHSEQLNTLLTHLTDYWCEQYPDRYITKIYAQAESKRGDILIQKLFFAPREDLAPDAYMLNLARPGASRFVRRFQECMETKRKALEAAQKR